MVRDIESTMRRSATAALRKGTSPRIVFLSLRGWPDHIGTSLPRLSWIHYFHVVGLMRDYGLNGECADLLALNSSPVVIPYVWEFPQGQCTPCWRPCENCSKSWGDVKALRHVPDDTEVGPRL
jgi:hypothetical protein